MINLNASSPLPVNNPKMAILTATPLTIHFFFKQHLFLYSKFFDVTLLLNHKNDSYILPLNLPVKEVSVSISRKISIFKDLICLYQLIHIFKNESFDIFFSVAPKAGLLGMLAAYITGVPKRVHLFQGEVWASKKGLNKIILKAADWITSSLATHVLAVSHTEKLFLEREHVVQPDMAKVLGAGSVCGVDLDRYRFKSETRSQMRQQLGIPKEAFAILFIGRMVKDKGIIELSHAFKNIAAKNLNTYLIFVGPDEDGLAEHALQILKDVSEQCRFIGYTNETEKYIATADVLCLPSYREGFPIVILEAAAMQVPSIGSDIYGVSDAILDRETGLLFKAGSVVDLERVIELMINDEHLRLKLGRSAYARVCSQFESDLVVSRYLEFFTNLMKITLKV